MLLETRTRGIMRDTVGHCNTAVPKRLSRRENRRKATDTRKEHAKVLVETRARGMTRGTLFTIAVFRNGCQAAKTQRPRVLEKKTPKQLPETPSTGCGARYTMIQLFRNSCEQTFALPQNHPAHTNSKQSV